MPGVDLGRQHRRSAAVLDLAGECAEHLLDPAECEADLATLRRAGAGAAGGAGRAGARSRHGRGARAAAAAAPRGVRLLPLVEALRAAQARRRRDRLRRPGGARRPDRAERARGRRGASGPRYRGRAARRVPGHQPRPARAAAGAVRRRPPGDRGRRPAPVDLRLARRVAPATSTGSPTHFPRRPDGAPAPVLPTCRTSWRNDARGARRRQRARRAAAAPPPRPATARSRCRRCVPRPGAGPGAVRVELHADRGRGEAAAAVADGSAAGPARPRPAPRPLDRRAVPQAVAVPAAGGRAAGSAGCRSRWSASAGCCTCRRSPTCAATLQVLHDPTARRRAGPAAHRARWRLGPRDLDALGRLGAALVQQPAPRRPSGRRQAGRPRSSRRERASIVEALDDLPPPGWAGAAGEPLSADRPRPAAAAGGAAARPARRGPAPALPDLVRRGRARAAGSTSRSPRGRARRRPRPGPTSTRFPTSPRSSPRRRAADARRVPRLAGRGRGERARPGAGRGASRDDDAVQLLTVHAAKGLEWDVVAVPGLTEGTSRPRASAGRRRAGDGGDADLQGLARRPRRGAVRRCAATRDDLPRLGCRGGRRPGDLDDGCSAFTRRAASARRREERRLAYVAVTRARHGAAAHRLLCGATATASRAAPSRFLRRGGAEVAAPVERRGRPGRPATGARRTRGSSPPAAGALAGRPAAAARRPRSRPARRLVRARTSRPRRRRGRPRPASRTLHGAQLGPRGRPAAGRAGRRPRAARPDVAAARHLSASALVALRRGPGRAGPPAAPADAGRSRARRPAAAPRSTPGWRSGSAPRGCVDLDELPGAGDDDAAPDDDLAALQERVPGQRVGRPAAGGGRGRRSRPPVGRRGAARPDRRGLRRPDGGWDVVDWKTGPPPSGAGRDRPRPSSSPPTGWPGRGCSGVPLERVGAGVLLRARPADGAPGRPARRGRPAPACRLAGYRRRDARVISPAAPGPPAPPGGR